MGGSLRESVNVRAGLEQARFLILDAKTCFLDGFAEDMAYGNVPSVATASTGTISGMITEAEDLAAQEALFEKWDTEAVLQGGVRSASQSK